VNGLFRKSVVVVNIKILSSIAAFLISVVLARALSVEEVGIYFLCISIITFVSNLCSLGFRNGVIRFNSIFKVNNDKNSASTYTITTLLLTISICALVSFVVFGTSDILSVYVFKNLEVSSTLKMMIFAAPLLASYTLLSHVIQVSGRLYWSMALASLIPNITLLLLFTVLGYFKLSSLSFFSMVYFITALFVFLIALSFTYRDVLVKPYSVGSISEVIKGSWSYYSTLMVTQSLPLLMPTILTIFSTTTDVAFFALSMKLMSLLSFILIGVNRIVAPNFSELFEKGEISAARDLTRKIMVIVMGTSIPIFLLMLIFMENILLIYGTAYQEAYVVAILVLLGQLLNVLSGPVGNILQMSGEQSRYNKVVVYSTIFSACVAILTIPPFGAIGAAVSILTLYGSINIISAVSVFRIHKINVLKVF